jgi:DNA-binding response OmpR family regulator
VEDLSLRLPEVAQTHRIEALVADDDDVVREIVCAPLRRWGLRVHTARNGEEAWQVLQKETGPALAVLDWVMPGINGLDLCRHICAAAKHVYILLLTARSGKQDIMDGLQAGANDYLVKRISQAELYVRLSLAIRILTLEAQLKTGMGELMATTTARTRPSRVFYGQTIAARRRHLAALFLTTPGSSESDD